LTGFLSRKIPKMTRVKKDHLINMGKSIWTCHCY
jgi:hypothetical protein